MFLRPLGQNMEVIDVSGQQIFGFTCLQEQREAATPVCDDEGTGTSLTCETNQC